VYGLGREKEKMWVWGGFFYSQIALTLRGEGRGGQHPDLKQRGGERIPKFQVLKALLHGKEKWNGRWGELGVRPDLLHSAVGEENKKRS